MTVTVKDIMETLEAFAPAAWAYDWDKPGLSIGDPQQRVSKVLVCLTVTEAVLQVARKAKVHMVISHHPMIMTPLRSLRSDDVHTRLCLGFAEAKIACFAAHTNLDVAPGGVNAALAQALGLTGLAPLFPAPHAGLVKLVTFVPESRLAQVRQAVSEAGAGVIGEYTYCSFSTPGTGTFMPGIDAAPFSGTKGRVNEEPERRFETLVPKVRLPRVLSALFNAHPYEEVAYDVVPLENRDTRLGLGIQGTLKRPVALATFAKQVRNALGVDHVRVVDGAKRLVQHVAVLGGSGGSQEEFLPRGVDVLVTGDVKYHFALAAQANGLSVIDAGHLGTERVVLPVLAQCIQRQFKGIKVAQYDEPECFAVCTG